MNRFRRALALAATAWPLVVGGLTAQGVTTAAIFGSVTGADSTAIVDAVISVTNTSTGERWQTATRSRGSYVFEYLSLGGPYIVEARAIGFAPTSRTGIQLSLGERHRVDLTLSVAILELPEIAVTAVVDPLVNAGRTGPAQTISDTVISRLPVRARDFAQLIYLSPQAVLTSSGGVSIAGQSDRLNGFQIDGATNLDLTGASGGGGFGTPAASSGVRTLSVEALRELQILTAPFDVRYGTFAGGLVNAVTRSGSNRWEGSLSGYFEDKALTGKDSTGERAADFSTKELALTLAGPIVRDRAAFFLDLGLQRDLTPQAVPGIGSDTTGAADSAGVGIRYASAVRFQEILRNTYGEDAGSFAAAPERRPSGNLFAKVTVQPALNHRLELSHNYGHGSPELPGGRTPYDVYSLTSGGIQIPGTINATRLTWTTARGGRLANELNVAYLRVRERCQPPVGFPEVQVRADEGFLVAGVSAFCDGNFANQNVWELTDNLSWYHGTHQLTFGTHTELIRTRRVDLIQPLGHWDFSSLDALEAGLPEAYFRTLTNPLQPDKVQDLGINQLGFYAQDQWAVTPRLTLTAGIRMDVPFFTSSPVGNPLLKQSELGIDNTLTPAGHPLWAPRLGFSYDLRGRGFLRGGVGLFAGRPAYHWLNSVYAFNGLQAPMLFCGGPDVPAFTLDPASQPRHLRKRALHADIRGELLQSLVPVPPQRPGGARRRPPTARGHGGDAGLSLRAGSEPVFRDRRQPPADGHRRWGGRPGAYSVALTVASPAAQIDLNRRLLRRDLPKDDADQIRAITAFNWAARGAWDSALATIDRSTGASLDSVQGLDPYRLAVLGVWLGAIPNARAVEQRPSAAAALAIKRPVVKAELAWLDGILAVARQDPIGLAAARAAMAAARDHPARARLVDLAPFDLALRGNRAAAAARLATREIEIASEAPWAATADFSVMRAIDRMAAAPWLLAAGDTTRAVELLTWHQAYSAPFMEKISVAPLAYLQLARIEEARGQVAAAQRDYRQFLVRYDMPPPIHRPLVAEASAALARLTGAPDPSEGR